MVLTSYSMCGHKTMGIAPDVNIWSLPMTTGVSHSTSPTQTPVAKMNK